jgi:hypothetical protein
MAFFEKGKSIPVDRNFLSYSYPETTLFNSGQWERKNLTYYSSNYYYKITYPIGSGSNGAKLTYAKKGIPSVYTPTYMYIFSLLHNNITGITSPNDSKIVGELVIEHKNNNNDNKLFLCILLKEPESQYGGPVSSIDNILEMIDSDQTAVNVQDKNPAKTSCELLLDKKDIIKNQNCFIYKDTIRPNNTVIVLTEPIMLGIKTNANQIAKFEDKTDLFSISAPTNYESETSGASTNDPPETSDNKVLGKSIDDEIYIDCQPTGTSLEEIATYNIPIGSALSNDMQKIDYMKTSVNFFLFCLGLILVYIGVPMLYKMMVIDKTLSKVNDPLERKKTIRAADVLICTFGVYYILSSFYYGFKSDGEIALILNGLFGFVIMGISVSLILIKKLDPAFLTYNGEKVIYEEGEEKKGSFTESARVFGLIAACIGFMTSTTGALLHILAVNFIVLMILIFLRYGPKTIPDNKSFGEHFKRYCLFYVPLFISLFIFLSQP